MARRPSPKKQVSFPIPTPTWLRLKAAAAVLGHSQARIVSDALQGYFETLSPARRKLIDEVLAQREKV